MGIASWLGFRSAYIPPQSVTAQPILDMLAAELDGKTPEQLWREQPHLRTVVDFLGRNIAQLGLHSFKLKDDDSRERQRSGVVADTLSAPNAQDTTYDLIEGTVCDYALYDIAYWLMMANADRPSGYEIRRIPPRWVTGVYDKTAFDVGGYHITFPDDNQSVIVPAENMLVFHGWNPDDPKSGSSRIEALKDVLYEQISARAFRRQMWDKGGRVGAYLTRPADAPKWSNEGRTRFKKGWSAAYSGNGGKVGGVPVLEDGMEMKRVSFTAKEEQFVEGDKLSLATVASVYHINPTMVGLLDNANYSNVREFRRGLYGDTLGPLLTMIQRRINATLLPFLGAGPGEYVEFNIREKLEGSFEEQGNILYQAAGAPFMSRNEVRAKLNLPAIEGADEMIIPLNLGRPGEQGDQADVESDDEDE